MIFFDCEKLYNAIEHCNYLNLRYISSDIIESISLWKIIDNILMYLIFKAFLF